MLFRATSLRLGARSVVASAPRPRRFRPQLDPLEDRLVLSTLVVDPTLGKGNYTTIQAAVNAANAGDVINIDTGTYQEQVVVNKNLTLETTPGMTNATIQAPAALTGSNAIVDFTGTAVTTAQLHSLIIQGPASSLEAGVIVEKGATGVTISGNSISAIKDRNNMRFGNQTGVGILIGGDSRGVFTAGGATVSSNTISDYQKAGIVVDNTGSSATISSNTVTGAGKTNAIAQVGIQVGFGATATVTGNTVQSNIYGQASASTFEAAGILLYEPGSGTSVTNNSVTKADIGIWALDAAGGSISNNSVSSFNFEGIDLDAVSTGCSNMTVSNNSIANSNGAADGIILFNATGCNITNNSISSVGENGIWLAGGDTSNKINSNAVSKSGGDGIVVADYAAARPNGVGTTSSSSGNTFSQNSVSGSGTYDALDVSSGSGTAGTANTWKGDALGTKSPSGLK